MRTIKPALKAAVFAILLAGASALSAEPDFNAMLKSVDNLLSFPGRDLSVTYSVVDMKPGKPDSYYQWSFFRRDEKEEIVMLTLKPEAKAGNGILKIGDDVYMYEPDAGWTLYSLSKDIEGTKAKTSDFRGVNLSEDYSVAASAEDTLGGRYPCWVLTLKAKTSEVSYAWMKVWIRKDKPLIMKEEDYSPDGVKTEALLRTVTYPPKYVEVGGKTMPVEIRMVDEVVKGNKTILSISTTPASDPKRPQYLIAVGYTDASGKYSDRLPESTFTKAFIEKANKK